MYVDVGGYEGPLDLLLDLARRQKVDLAQISVLALAEQYLSFIETVREKRIEIAADYLVMAAWLAYLKSRLMVPQAAGRRRADRRDDGGAAAVPAEAARSHAPRGAAAHGPAAARAQASSAAASPSRSSSTAHSLWEASLFDLLKAYATQRERGVPNDYTPLERTVWSLQEARDILNRLIGDNMDWVPLDAYLAAISAARTERAGHRDGLDLCLEP